MLGSFVNTFANNLPYLHENWFEWNMVTIFNSNKTWMFSCALFMLLFIKTKPNFLSMQNIMQYQYAYEVKKTWENLSILKFSSEKNIFQELLSFVTKKGEKEKSYGLLSRIKLYFLWVWWNIADHLSIIISHNRWCLILSYILQVEYCPCVVASDCWNLIKEMAQSIVGNVADNPPMYIKNKTDPVYSPSDTVNQYLEHFNNFRKTAPQGQPSRWTLLNIQNLIQSYQIWIPLSEYKCMWKLTITTVGNGLTLSKYIDPKPWVHQTADLSIRRTNIFIYLKSMDENDAQLKKKLYI